MTEKTPLSILQELAVSWRTQPIFELIYDGTGMQNPTFKYQVDIALNQKKIQAIGCGRSKKEAKHSSATAALEKLAEINIYLDETKFSAKSVVQIPPSIDVTNAIRKLVVVCNTRNLPRPEYELIDNAGAPHARQFTMECSIASLKVRAIATSKKVAKQLSAANMITKLQTVENQDIVGKRATLSTQFVNCNALSKKHNKIILIQNCKDYDSPFKNFDQEKVATAKHILNNDLKSDEDKTRESFEVLGFEYEISETPTIRKGSLYLLSTTNVEPEICLSAYTMIDLFKETNYFLSVMLS